MLSRLLALASVFTSAFLLFLLEPMTGKMLLPQFGGSPAVWATCLMFFQGLLLLGYGYGHALGRMPPRIAVRAHLALLLAPLAVLPFPVHRAWAPAPDAWPVPALLAALTLTAALPFFAFATNTSLIHDWFARRNGAEPWFLYAGSNAGSLGGLLAYPFLFERVMGLHAQARFLTGGYVLFFALTAGTALVLRAGALAPRPPRPASAVALRRRLRWLGLSTIGSLLLLAVTTHLSEEIAAVPLLWVIPLALYLLTFVIAFARPDRVPRQVLTLVVALLVTLALYAGSLGGREPFFRSLVLASCTIFFGALLCHGDLARERPDPGEVTSYFLWIAAGGFLGGVLGSIVAPLVFSTIAEWPLALVALAAVAATGDPRKQLVAAVHRPRWWLGPAAFVAILLLADMVRTRGHAALILATLAPLGVLLAGVILWRVPGFFLAASGAVASFTLAGFAGGTRPLDVRRGFFGVVRIVQTDDGFRAMYHGQTIHGAQLVNPPSPLPLLYYAPEGPMAQAIRNAPDGARIAIVGMGAGALAASGRRGQSLTFFEIDSLIEPMARRWFTFLPQSEAQITTVLGDARLTLQTAAPFDLIVVDAFSGDGVPAHLLTVEAMQLYLSRLAPRGLLVMHLSNRHLTLVPLVHGAARQLGVEGVVMSYVPPARWLAPTDDEDRPHWSAASVVVALAPDSDRLAPLRAAGGWTALDAQPEPAVVWTDDRSSILDILK